MTQIWKYELDAERDNVISMPTGAVLLTVQVQTFGNTEIPCVWALVDTGAPLQRRLIGVIGTGRNADPYMQASSYIGTFQLRRFGLVFHVFDGGLAE